MVRVSKSTRVKYDCRNLVGSLKEAGRVLVIAAILFPVFRIYLWTKRHARCFQQTPIREATIHSRQRECPLVPFPTLEHEKPRICLTTLSDRVQPSMWRRLLRCRDFSGIFDLILSNHKRYASIHGYKVVDSSDQLDSSRPPSWSKIQAAKRLLFENDSCDWVMWVDADVVFMNPRLSIESLIPKDPQKHLVLSEDEKFGYNAGAWLLRKSDWSKQFLENWWEQRNFVLPAGTAHSGDNAALGHLLRKETYQAHLGVVPRCRLNSFAAFLEEGDDALKFEHLNNTHYYHRGDFVAHAAGVQQKDSAVRLLLERAKTYFDDVHHIVRRET